MRTLFLLVTLATFAFACTRPPILNHCPSLPPLCYHGPQHCSRSFFPPLSCEERRHEWAKEILIGEAFAREADFYRALTAFKRAKILLQEEGPCQRLYQVEYEIILTYFCAHKYDEVVCSFQKSCLATLTPDQFPAFRDLLIMLFETAVHLKESKGACEIAEFIQQSDPCLANRLMLGQLVSQGALDKAVQRKDAPPYFRELLCQYQLKKKSIKKAETLSMLLPGAGFWYAGQPASAMTAFLLNGLFIAATYQCFHRGYTAAGIVLGSLEVGWYVGGIYGAGQAAADYNQHLYQKIATKAMEQERLYPLLMLQYTF